MLASYNSQGIGIVKNELETFSPLSIQVRHLSYTSTYNAISIVFTILLLEFNEWSETTVEESGQIVLKSIQQTSYYSTRWSMSDVSDSFECFKNKCVYDPYKLGCYFE